MLTVCSNQIKKSVTFSLVHIKQTGFYTLALTLELNGACSEETWKKKKSVCIQNIVTLEMILESEKSIYTSHCIKEAF